jgi:endonuclease/exonuclease/phosphatase family metal-dependent hydrolase
MSEDFAAVAMAEHEDSDRTPKSRWYRRRWLRFLSWAGTAGVLFYTLVRVFGWETGWVLVTTIAFVPYFILAALGGLALQLLVRHWAASIATGAAILALAAVVAPRLIEDAQPVTDGPELTVLSVNLYVGEANLDYVIELVKEHQPDLLSVQELTPGAADALGELGIENLLPHTVLEPDELAVGTGLYSKYPVERIESVGRDGIFYQIGAEVQLGDQAVRFMAVHTAAPATPERIPLWEEDFVDMPRPDGGVPWVLAGDFNATLDHENMRDLLADGYVDAAEVTGGGLDATWQPIEGRIGGLVRPPAVALDHVLVDDGIEVLDWEVLDKQGSDHAPVLAHLRLP